MEGEKEKKPKDRKEHLKEKNSIKTICPFNSEHIIKKKRLKKHIQACLDNPVNKPTYGKSYIIHNCNKIDTVEINTPLQIETFLPILNDEIFKSGIDKKRKGSEYVHCDCIHFSLSKLNIEVLKLLMTRVKRLYEFICKQYSTIVAPVSNNIEINNTIDYLLDQKTLEVEVPRYWGKPNQKMTVQCFSIIKHLIEKGILKNTSNCTQQIIETGAGTGQLSASYLLLPHENKNYVYLVDRMNASHKRFDRIGKYRGDEVKRIVADLCDFDPTELIKETMHNQPSGSVSIIGKHLCGSATDMVLRMAVRCSKQFKLNGIGIALCCHMKGDGHDDCMSDFFKSLGVSLLELTVIHRMSSWASSLRDLQEKQDDCIEINEAKSIGGDEEFQKDQRIIGEMCKTLLNVARVVWLKNQNVMQDVGLVKYCLQTITPENVLLWGVGK
ncbi:methyltransferase trm13 protein [Entamoeba histolytica HM-3:IMSS]|uniref:tRNA:m(4)X modification enzyme TRM13 n=5 Tax=Entamoeba histolytica TaxID=5759 RepID=C4M757_ENTH1|nr:hypothetical protein EHI_083130 [Entamoeba histolytica HM-1:IMSS]EMD43513.1 methyltransferase TRM13 protein, putative [Entamoeba histolytica KU27]EMS15372.1 methyltransferase trm13 protein [Entamoeba histolytica HM-3:IMSS]ENY64561.1 hypothetical protein EHI7A_000410 [Entamoeba histolytica HM-1:IMSS-A]GAT97348.1 hypothetical protein CL6EHI_083130 [Entamoeba histolytica]EAL49622.2 hypothetical protein EHI_083130 [Entamoeba histolytica HM-1:IMSS]|eukprot:XP_655008.2 hypothetical protein EHI_083130 [Entamoeba histolytica HM-1:IMSS]